MVEQTLTQEETQILSNYARKYGFQYDGEWYIKHSWLRPSLRERFRESGVLVRAGTAVELRQRGIPVESHRHQSGTVYYKVNVEI